jgi:hypothetical protein
MARVYSTCFIAQQGLGTTITYTVPPGFIAIVRDLDSYNSTFTNSTIRFIDAQTGGTIWVAVNNALATDYESWRGRQVFETGQQFTVSVTGDPWDVRVSGYLLDTP